MSNNEARIITDQDWEWWCGLPDSLKYILMRNSPYIGDLVVKLDDKGKIESNYDLYDRAGYISRYVGLCTGCHYKGQLIEGLEDLVWYDGVSTEEINKLAHLTSIKRFRAARDC